MTTATTTVLQKLLQALEQACAYNRNDQVPPAVLLWPDQDRQWELLMPRLRGILPQLLTLGSWDPTTRTGPAIWLRCLLARTLSDITYWPEEATPILYLPGVSRSKLRAVEDCPADLQPLAALQYRGAFFSHANGKDWTIAAFLQSDKFDLGLDVARDVATLDALKTALVELVDVEAEKLIGKQLSADDFNNLILPDPERQLLQWLNDPTPTRKQWDKNRWKTFRNICKRQYGFDPKTDGEIVAAELLGLRGSKWETVWQRYAVGPDPYPNIPDRLRVARPKDKGLFDFSESWPQDNEQMEQELRQALHGLKNVPAASLALRQASLGKGDEM